MITPRRIIGITGFIVLFFSPLIGIAMIIFAAIIMPTISAILWNKENKEHKDD